MLIADQQVFTYSMKAPIHSILTSIVLLLAGCQSQDQVQPKLPVSLDGKQLVALGNSITAPDDSWAWVTAQYFGMTLTNLAVSGAHLTDYYNTCVDTNEDPRYNEDNTNNVISNQIFRLLQMIVPAGTVIPETDGEIFHNETPSPLTGLRDPDSTFTPFFVIISCGTNDAAGLKAIGDISQLDNPYQEADRKTIYGAIYWAVSVIRKYSPSTQIILLTPIQRSPLPERLPLIVEAIQRAGEKLDCHTIDMYNESGITTEVESQEHKYLYDGLHPNAEGSRLMGQTVIRHLQEWYTSK